MDVDTDFSSVFNDAQSSGRYQHALAEALDNAVDKEVDEMKRAWGSLANRQTAVCTTKLGNLGKKVAREIAQRVNEAHGAPTASLGSANNVPDEDAANWEAKMA